MTHPDPIEILTSGITRPHGGAGFDAITTQRAIGALVGSAVGDALGAPFEFGAAGAYSARFPEPVIGGIGEMIGGGSFHWRPGEFTDDTQMAVALALSITEHDGLDADDVWARFVAWRRTAGDVGNLTRRALHSSDWRGAALDAHDALGGRSAANGALMRVTPIALAWAAADEATLMTVARAQAALTHHDPDAGWGAAIGAALIRRAILGEDPIAALPEVLALVDQPHRDEFAALCAPDWCPGDDTRSNGSVYTCLAEAVWAVRTTTTFADAVRAAVDLGGDTDTVACVTGAIAGARASIQAIPSRWTTYVHGRLGTPEGEARFDNDGLAQLARRLLGKGNAVSQPVEHAAGPVPVAPGLWAANLTGAARAPEDVAVVSLCLTHGLFSDRPVRREVHLIDRSGPANADPLAAVRDAVDSIDALLAEGHEVVVHCHGGRSRTGLVLKAWAMRNDGVDERGAHAWLAERWPLYHDQQRSFVELLRYGWT